MTRSSRATRAAVAAILAVGLIAGTAPSAAMADGVGFALSHGTGGSTNLGVTGSGTWVSTVRVSHGDGAIPVNYCHFQSKFGGTLISGAAWSATWGYTPSCTPFPYYNDAIVYRDFKVGTAVWGQSYHDGAWAPGRPAVSIQ